MSYVAAVWKSCGYVRYFTGKWKVVTTSSFLMLCVSYSGAKKVILAEPTNVFVDSTAVGVTTLDDFVVEHRTRIFYTDSVGRKVISSKALRDTKRLFGEADIINVLKNLPGVSSVGEYSSGINVNGNEAWHTVFSIDGAPILFPYRFGGIFSSFNSAFFKDIHWEKTIHDVSFPLRLGGGVALSPRSFRKIQGELNVGLLASSLTVGFPIGRKFSLEFGGRVSYLNKLYGPMLSGRDTEMKYDFSDLNFSAELRPDECNLLRLNVFNTADRLNLESPVFLFDSSFRWKNNMVGLHWRNNSRIKSEVSLYYSIFRNKSILSIPQIEMSFRSSLSVMGLKTDFKMPLSPQNRLAISYGATVNGYNCEPQSVMLSNISSINGDVEKIRNAFELMVYARADWQTTDRLKISGGVLLGYYCLGNQFSYVEPDPRLTLFYKAGLIGNFRLHAAVYHQNLHLVGISELGLASNFWFLSTRFCKPQKSKKIVLSWSKRLKEVFQVEFEIYYAGLSNQSEYFGDVLDMIGSNYNWTDYVSAGKGYNVGFNSELSFNSGKFDGMLSYSYGIARRKNSKICSDWYNSLTSPGSRLNLSVNWHCGHHWNLMASFAYNFGRVYTPLKYYYMIGGNILSEYERHNSGRMSPYRRLDLSATYSFSSGGRLPMQHILNLSLINVLGFRNVELQYISFDKENNSFFLKQQFSLYRFLPSLSYTLVI